MSILEVILLGISVAMDAFAVSICKGMNSQKKLKTAITCGAWFSIFQMLMPLIGFLVGALFANLIESFDHWVVLVLLCLLGINMIKEAISKKDEEKIKNDTSFKEMLLLSLATSIDALAVGISLALVEVNILLAIAIIGIITFAFCFIGSIIGQNLGEKHQKVASIIGGVILILLGIKIVVEHLWF